MGCGIIIPLYHWKSWYQARIFKEILQKEGEDSADSSPSSRHLAWQEGQNPLILHENIISLSVPQSPHRIRAKPHFGLPQSRLVARNAVTKQSHALGEAQWDHHGLSGLVMTYGHFLNHWTKIAVLSFEAVLVFCNKFVKIMKKNSIKDSTFRMTLTVYPCHRSRDDS